MAGQSEFSTYLEELMRQRGLRPSQIAAFAGVSPSMVSQWRRGARPTPESLRKLATGLSLDYDLLLQIAGISGAAITRERGTTGGVPSVTGAFAATVGSAVRAAMDELRAEAHDQLVYTETELSRLAELSDGAIIHSMKVQERFAHAGDDGASVDGEIVYEMPQMLGSRFLSFPVVGDCMAPDVNDGERVIAHLDGRPRDGQLVVAEIDGHPQVRLYDAARKLLWARDGSRPIRVRDVGAIIPVMGIYRDAHPARRKSS